MEQEVNATLLHDIMQEMGKKKRVFQNEAQFQFELAWRIREKNNKVKIYLEPLVVEKAKEKGGRERVYADMVVEDENKNFVVIELKYKTARSTYDNMELLPHGAADLGRYDFLHDIVRIEELKGDTPHKSKFVSKLGSFAGGYAVMLTNDKDYWEKSRDNNGYSYKNFCISNNDSIKKGERLEWHRREGRTLSVEGTSRGDALPFNDAYTFEWKPYYGENEQPAFQYLLVEIKK